jgi:hypothetical protein
VRWLPLAKFTYNNSLHALSSITLFFTETCFYPSIKATVQAIPANGFVYDVPDAKAWVENSVELWAAIEQRWKEVVATQQK